MMSRSLVFVLACSAIAASPAAAQTRNGLFGATLAGTDARDRLTFQMSLSEAFDSKVPVEFQSRRPGNLAIGRYSSLFSGSADYVHGQRHVDVLASASSYVRYNAALERAVAGPQSGQLGATFHLPQTGSLSIGEDAAYSPSYLYELFPGDVTQAPEAPPPVNADYRIDTATSYSSRSHAELHYGRAVGTQMSAAANYRLADYRGQHDRPDLHAYEAGATISHAPSRSRSFSVGYFRRSGRHGSGAWTGEQELRLGLSLSPALSATRRVTLKVTVTPTLIDGAIPARRSMVQGNAGINYPFTLRWTMSAGYRRGVDYLAVLTEPVITDAGTAGITGAIGRRMSLSAEARYGTSLKLRADGHDRLKTATANARVRFALSRSFALFAEYLYYYYDHGIQSALAPDLPDRYEQHGARVGVLLFSQPIDRARPGRVRH
jgi:opacity protein-like surface antigen